MIFEELDVRAIVKLLGETAAIDGAHNIKKRFLMDGLSDLIKADAWIWSLGAQVKPNESQVFVGFIHGGFDKQQFSRYLLAVEHKDMGVVASKFAENLVEDNRQITMTREAIDPEGNAYKGELGGLWKAANIGPVMLSGYPLGHSSISCVGMYRRDEAQPFSARDRAIAHVILAEVPWLHMTGWPEDKGAKVPKLYPRQRIVLNLLLDGLSRKEIAGEMDISINTVSSYIKEVFRHFGVNSHVELIKKFMHADTA